MSNDKETRINEEQENKQDKIVDISSKEKKSEKEKADKAKATKKTTKKDEKPKAESKAPKKTPKKKKAVEASPKKLTLDDLKNEDKKLVAKKSEIINIGGSEYEIIVDNHFRKTKKRDMINDMIKFFQALGERNMEDFEMATAYTMLLLVKHFTSLEVSDDIDEAMATLEVLIDTEAIGQIVALLPENEVVEMYELLSDTVNSMTQKIEDIEKEIEKAEEGIEDPKVKKYIKKTLGSEDVEPSADDNES